MKASSSSAWPRTSPSPPGSPPPVTSPAAPLSSPTRRIHCRISFLVELPGCHLGLGRFQRTKNTLMVTLDPDMVSLRHWALLGFRVCFWPLQGVSLGMLSIFYRLYRITKKAGEREGSELMKANAWHHRADAVSSVVALIGVGGSILGVPILDPVAGIFVSCLILKAGIETGYRSVMELVDAGVPLHVLAPIRQTILQAEGVKGCHRLRGRKAGSFLYLDVHIEVDPFLSVTAAHDIGENVRREIQNSHAEVAESFIHIDPSFSHCSSLEDKGQNLRGIETQKSDIFSNEKDAEAVVSNVAASLFPEKMKVEHIKRHSIGGKVLLEVQVSMPPEMSIREAKEMAREAEREVLTAAPCVDHVSIQLRLGDPIPQLHSE